MVPAVFVFDHICLFHWTNTLKEHEFELLFNDSQHAIDEMWKVPFMIHENQGR